MDDVNVVRMEQALGALEERGAVPHGLSASEHTLLDTARRILAVRSTEAAPATRPWVAAATAEDAASATDGDREAGSEERWWAQWIGVLAATWASRRRRRESSFAAGQIDDTLRSRDAWLMVSAVSVVVVAVVGLAWMSQMDTTVPVKPPQHDDLPVMVPTDESPIVVVASPMAEAINTSTPKSTALPVGAVMPTRSARTTGATVTAGADTARITMTPTAWPSTGSKDGSEAAATNVPLAPIEATAAPPTQMPTAPAPSATAVASAVPPTGTSTPEPQSTPTAPARRSSATVPPTQTGGPVVPTYPPVTMTPPPTWTGGVPTADYTPNPDPGPTILPTQWTPAPTSPMPQGTSTALPTPAASPPAPSL